MSRVRECMISRATTMSLSDVESLLLCFANEPAASEISLVSFSHTSLMPTLQNPGLSIVIPTHNRPSALLWCLQHLEVQVFSKFEVIIADDGSTPSTSKAVAEYKAHPALDIVYVRQENSGPAKARNTAVQLARAPICLFIGDDILCTPLFTQVHYDFHQKNPSEAACGLGLTRWESTKQKLTPFMKCFEDIQFSYRNLLAGEVPTWRHFYTSNLSVKTAPLLRHPFSEKFPNAAMEDMELAYRINRSEGLKLDFLPEALAFHYHPTTLKQACRRSIEIGRSIQIFEQRWPEANLLPEPMTVVRRIGYKVLAVTTVRLAITSILASMSRFYCSAVLTRALLSSYVRASYQQCANDYQSELRLNSTNSQGIEKATE
jgi:GT2 family glycosyltransferase